MTANPGVFGVSYQFLSCGSVFTDGIANAASDLGIEYHHAAWDAEYLEETVRSFSPDLLLVVHGRRFSQRFPDFKVFGVPTAVWLLDESYEVDDTATYSPRFDHVFINDRATLHRHPNASYLPTCYDPHVHTPCDGPRAFSVGFIGGANGTRERYLAALADAGLLGYVVGGAWGSPSVNAVCRASNITPTATSAFYRNTRIVLNIWRETHHFNREGIPATSLNPRVYEATACGALVVSEWRPEIDTLCPNIPTFRSEEHCVELVKYLLADPVLMERIRLKCAAQLAGHTYAARLQTVLAKVGMSVAGTPDALVGDSPIQEHHRPSLSGSSLPERGRGGLTHAGILS